MTNSTNISDAQIRIYHDSLVRLHQDEQVAPLAAELGAMIDTCRRALGMPVYPERADSAVYVVCNTSRQRAESAIRRWGDLSCALGAGR